MALCPGDTTEWDDIQRKFGNFAPKEKEVPQRQIEQAVVEALEKVDPLELCTLEDLQHGEDDIEEDLLARYRRRRLQELKAARQAAKFGEVLQVGRTTFVAEVTEASADGQWVLVLLYVDAHHACQQLMAPWAEAARRFPSVKFMRGVASEVVPDYPDDATPTVLLYKDKDCEKQIVGLEAWGGARRCSGKSIEWVLASFGVVKTEIEVDPRSEPAAPTWRRLDRRGGGAGSDSEEEDDGGAADEERQDDRCYTSMKLTQSRRGR